MADDIDPTRGRPDAARIPFSLRKPGSNFVNRHFVLETAERLLQVDKGKGEQAHGRKQAVWDAYYCTRSNDTRDSIFFGTSHDLEGRPRFRWEDRGDGVELGWLTDEAKADMAGWGEKR